MFKLVPDHIVISVPNLKEAMDFFEKEFSIRPIMGGKHLGLGTHNALLGLGNPEDKIYLELLAIDPEAEVKEYYPMGLSPHITKPYIATWCIRCVDETDIVEVTQAISKLGNLYHFGQVRDMQRQTINNDIISWRIAFSVAQYHLSHGHIPFLISWDDMALHPAATMNKLKDFIPYQFTIFNKEYEKIKPNLVDVGLKLNDSICFEYSEKPMLKLQLGKLIFTS